MTVRCHALFTVGRNSAFRRHVPTEKLVLNRLNCLFLYVWFQQCKCLQPRMGLYLQVQLLCDVESFIVFIPDIKSHIIYYTGPFSVINWKFFTVFYTKI